MAFKQIMHRLDIEFFGIKYNKKRKAKEVKELSEYVKANKKRHKTQHEEIKAAKTVTEEIQKVGDIIMGPKHKPNL